MKPWLKNLLLGCFGLSLFGMLMVGIVIWVLVSRLGTGYDNDGRTVTFHTFNNATWQVDRRDLQPVDPKTFRTLSGSGGNYGTDGQNVFIEARQIFEADADTFEVLDWRQKFSRDRNRAYYDRLPISDAPDNFQVLSQSYSKDAQQVYYMHHVVEGADPSTFVVTSEVTSKARDKNGEFRGKSRVE